MKKAFVSILSLILIVSMLGVTGCYGSFQLVQKVYKWNGTFGDKWVNELGFLVLTIVPVYGLSAFIDAVLLNSIEFWSGKNPMASNTTVLSLDPSTTLTFRGQDRSVLLTQKTDKGEVNYVFEKGDDGTIVKDLQGNILVRCAATEEGGMNLFDAQGVLISHCSSANVEYLSNMLVMK